VFQKGRESSLDQKRLQYTHENVMTDLMMSEPNDYLVYYLFIFQFIIIIIIIYFYFLCDLTVSHLMDHPRLLPPTIAKETPTCKK
jgi:hypothetical protein